MILRNRSKCRRPATFVSPLFLVATDRIMRARPCRDTEKKRERERASTRIECVSPKPRLDDPWLKFRSCVFFSFFLPIVSFPFLVSSFFLSFFLSFFFSFSPLLILQTYNSTYAANDKGFMRENITRRRWEVYILPPPPPRPYSHSETRTLLKMLVATETESRLNGFNAEGSHLSNRCVSACFDGERTIQRTIRYV